MAGAIVPSERELSFLIGEVQEVLPHLGTGFIEVLVCVHLCGFVLLSGPL